jgi:hypothetical protein
MPKLSKFEECCCSHVKYSKYYRKFYFFCMYNAPTTRYSHPPPFYSFHQLIHAHRQITIIWDSFSYDWPLPCYLLHEGSILFVGRGTCRAAVGQPTRSGGSAHEKQWVSARETVSQPTISGGSAHDKWWVSP